MSSFPRYRGSNRSVPLSELAEWVEGRTIGASNPEIRRIAPLAEAREDEMGLLASGAYLEYLPESRAGALLVSAELEGKLPAEAPPALVVPDAHRALAVLLERLVPAEASEPGIHPSAVVAPTAELGEGVSVGPFAVIEEEAVLGANVHVGSHSIVGAGVAVGEDSRIFPHVVLYPGCRIGRRVWIHSGARVGVDGFGYVFTEKGHRKVPQVGRCVIGDDVEIGANTTIDRGSIGDTHVGPGAKIDNLVQLGHNTRVGAHSVLAAQVGVAGSSRLGAGVMAGGQAGVAGHVTVGDRAQLSAQAGIIGDVEPGETVTGFPARPRMEFLRTFASQKKTAELVRKVRDLERQVAVLTDGHADL